ncbi:hypothetical protein B0H14DRAFT_2563333 [Mycena olivaceomarginata]|nr:hypothetical protein B0H14DRAFT_2563333 [Mycena olivaceomarginata]
MVDHRYFALVIGIDEVGDERLIFNPPTLSEASRRSLRFAGSAPPKGALVAQGPDFLPLTTTKRPPFSPSKHLPSEAPERMTEVRSREPSYICHHVMVEAAV